ncbi:M23 family metallopeptidase [Agromyces sp. SYSU T0242]|uniref:M23 family metallopeptidase n=1 Tax=Agromyces litoreus TaxID=3158561 RepID=UPI0033915FBE
MNPTSHGRRASGRPQYRRAATPVSAATANAEREAAAPAAPARAARRRTAALLRPAMTLGAMTLAGGMLLSTSLPALAVSATDAEARASVYAPDGDTLSLRPQSLEVGAEVALEPIEPGSFDVEKAPPPIQSSVAGLGSVSLVQADRVVWPVDPSRTSDGFGPRLAPCAGCSSVHDGIDFNPGQGATISSIADGVVITATESGGGFGAYVEVQHNIDGVVVTSLYAHMLYGSVSVSAGQRVTAGQALGAVGSTGQSTGPHLHLEMYGADGVRFDGMAWLSSHVTG